MFSNDVIVIMLIVVELMLRWGHDCGLHQVEATILFRIYLWLAQTYIDEIWLTYG